MANSFRSMAGNRGTKSRNWRSKVRDWWITNINYKNMVSKWCRSSNYKRMAIKKCRKTKDNLRIKANNRSKNSISLKQMARNWVRRSHKGGKNQ
jgi:hypothetical protein